VPGRKVLAIPGRPRPGNKYGHYLDGDGNLRLTFGGFLLRSGGRVALIDAGLGHVITVDGEHRFRFLQEAGM
jgi:hypothetical protein